MHAFSRHFEVPMLCLTLRTLTQLSVIGLCILELAMASSQRNQIPLL